VIRNSDDCVILRHRYSSFCNGLGLQSLDNGDLHDHGKDA
jgi:hypothetical protein